MPKNFNKRLNALHSEAAMFFLEFVSLFSSKIAGFDKRNKTKIWSTIQKRMEFKSSDANVQTIAIIEEIIPDADEYFDVDVGIVQCLTITSLYGFKCFNENSNLLGNIKGGRCMIEEIIDMADEYNDNIETLTETLLLKFENN